MVRLLAVYYHWSSSSSGSGINHKTLILCHTTYSEVLGSKLQPDTSCGEVVRGVRDACDQLPHSIEEGQVLGLRWRRLVDTPTQWAQQVMLTCSWYKMKNNIIKYNYNSSVYQFRDHKPLARLTVLHLKAFALIWNELLFMLTNLGQSSLLWVVWWRVTAELWKDEERWQVQLTPASSDPNLPLPHIGVVLSATKNQRGH